MKSSSSRNPAFTLVELLVCCGIVAVLSGIVLAVVSSSRGSARKSSCQEHQRQVALSILMYVQDNDDCWPGRDTWYAWSALHPGMPLCPHVDPERDHIEKLATDAAPGIFAYPGVPGYAYNTCLTSVILDLRTPRERRRALRTSDLPYPSVSVALSEQMAKNTTSARVDPYAGQFPYPDGIEESWKRHNGGANYAFCDGHVKWYAPEQVQSTKEELGPEGNDGTKPTFALYPIGQRP